VALTATERQRLLDALTPRGGKLGRLTLLYRAATRLAGWCGLRYGEVLAAGEDQVDEARGCLLVNRQLIYVVEAGWQAGPPKHGSTRLTVLPPCCLEDLAPVRERARRLGLRHWLDQDDGRPRHWQCPGHGWKGALLAAAQRAGLPQRVNPVVLRHTALSCWIAAGVPAAIADGWLGHRVEGLSRVGQDHYLGAWVPGTIDLATLG
jgi:integrase